MQIQDVIQSAECGKWPLVQLVVGSETFLVDRAVTALRQASVGECDAWNVQTIQAKTATAGQIVGAARTLPLLGGNSFVLVRNLDHLPSDEHERLATTSPLRSTVAVWC